MSPTKLKRLGDIFQRMQDYVNCGDIEGYLNASREFHQYIIEASENSRLIQMYKALSGQIWWLGTMILTRSDRSKASLRGHKRILDALIARDKVKVRKITEDHVRRGGQFFLEQFLRRQKKFSLALSSDQGRDEVFSLLFQINRTGA